MTTVADLKAFEEKMRTERGWKRGKLCEELGTTQTRWRRLIEHPDDEPVASDFGLTMSAVALGLGPYPAVYPAPAATAAPAAQETATA